MINKKFGAVKLIDLTTISMCIKFYQWALFRKNKANIKIHTKFDLTKGISEYFIVSNAQEHDRTKMKSLMKEKNCTYIFDKGYVDYRKFDEFTLDTKYSVTRLKDNAVINEIKELQITYTESKLLDNKTQILYDKVVQLASEYSNKIKKSMKIISNN